MKNMLAKNIDFAFETQALYQKSVQRSTPQIVNVVRTSDTQDDDNNDLLTEYLRDAMS